MKPVKANVGKRIQKIRERGNYSMSDFGKLLDNSSRGTVNNWEKGKRMPSNEILEKVAILGDTTVNKILYGGMEEYLFQLAKQNLGIEMNNQSILMILMIGKLRNLSYGDEVEWTELISRSIKHVKLLPTYFVYIPVVGMDNLYTVHLDKANDIEQSEYRGQMPPIFFAFAEMDGNLLHIMPFPLHTEKERLFMEGGKGMTQKFEGERYAKNFGQIGMEKEGSRLLYYGIDRESLTEKFQLYKYDGDSGLYKEAESGEADYYGPFVEETRKECLRLQEKYQ